MDMQDHAIFRVWIKLRRYWFFGLTVPFLSPFRSFETGNVPVLLPFRSFQTVSIPFWPIYIKKDRNARIGTVLYRERPVECRSCTG